MNSTFLQDSVSHATERVFFKASKHLLGIFSLKKKMSIFSHLLLKFLLKSHNLSVKCYTILAAALYLFELREFFNTLLLCLQMILTKQFWRNL